MATNINFFWKVWLRLNPLTEKEDNDYIAEVSTTGRTLRNEEIARLIVEERSEIKFDTLVSILNQSDRIKRERLAEGNSVLDGVCHFTPRVLGKWVGSSAKYDPAVHKLTLDAVPSAEMHKVLEQVEIELLGVKDTAGHIGLVTDVSTGKTDGSITPDEDILIEGDKIKVFPEEEIALGVFFVPVGSGLTVKVLHKLSHNSAAHITARVPDELDYDTEYTLKIVTRYSNGKEPLKEPRTIIYEKTLRTIPTPGPVPGK
jgi:hypothetical protein